MTQNAYISLGSNLGDRAGNLLLATRGMIAAGLKITRLSSIYESQPVDYVDQPLFLNMVAELDGCSLPSAEQLMARLLRIEFTLGRTREIPLGPRTIDLDLLIYKTDENQSQFVTLPHPRMHLRRFVLAPMLELAPELIHPTLHRTMKELFKELQDESEVKVWTP